MSSASKRSQSSAAKRLQYTVSPGSENVNGNTLQGFKSPLSQTHDSLQQRTHTVTTATQRSPVRGTVNGTWSNCSDAGNSCDIFPCRSSEVNQGSTVVNGRSTEVTRSPEVTKRSVNRSPKSVNGTSLKRGGLESPAGQPKTKKFIVERLRNAKTSRKKLIDVAASNKSSPVRKSPHRKYIGKSFSWYICSVFIIVIMCSLLAADRAVVVR